MTKRKKRFIAYLIDIIIVGIIITLSSKLLVNTNKIIVLEQQLNEINNNVLNSTFKFKESLIEYAEITKQIDLEKVMVDIVTIIMILIYFVFIPYYNNGQTMGMKILKTKIEPEMGTDLTIKKLMLRNFIIN